MHDRVGRVDRVLGHAADEIFLEAEDRMHLAHPVLATAAEAAFPTRDDLLGDDSIPEANTVSLGCALSEGDDMTGEFVTGDGRRFAVAALAVAAPEELAPQPALHIGSANATGINFD